MILLAEHHARLELFQRVGKKLRVRSRADHVVCQHPQKSRPLAVFFLHLLDGPQSAGPVFLGDGLLRAGHQALTLCKLPVIHVAEHEDDGGNHCGGDECKVEWQARVGVFRGHIVRGAWGRCVCARDWGRGNGLGGCRRGCFKPGRWPGFARAAFDRRLRGDGSLGFGRRRCCRGLALAFALAL